MQKSGGYDDHAEVAFRPRRIEGAEKCKPLDYGIAYDYIYCHHHDLLKLVSKVLPETAQIERGLP